nr:hypothetical protein [Tanacetum cinerariifolium]
MTISDKSDKPWYADYANYLASRVLPFRSTHQEKQNFFSDPRHFSGMNHFYSDNVRTKSYGDVSLRMSDGFKKGNVIVVLQEDIMGSSPLQEKFLRPSFTGLISFTMHENWSDLVMYVSEPATFLQGMKHPKSTFRNKYILVAIDYVSKRVEAQAFPTSDARNVVIFDKEKPKSFLNFCMDDSWMTI